MIIEGKNACLEVLKSVQEVNKIYLAKNADSSTYNEVVALAKIKNCRINFVDKFVLDKMSSVKKHQGIVIETTSYKYGTQDELLQLCNKDNVFLLMLDAVEDPHNLGSIIRTAECAGVDGIIISKNRSCDVNETVIRISSGATSYVKVFRVGNINDILREFKKINVFTYCLEADGKDIYKTNLKGSICLVVGSEGFGVSRLTRELCDEVLSMPLKGKINSLNASNATAIAVYEALRQRNN